jgi:carboxypeptidase C (cathepsin A)
MSKSVDYCRYDPSLEMVLGPMTAVFNAYLSSDLKWDKDQEYQILTQLRPWNYGNAAPNRFLNMSEDLREVMTKIPRTQLFVASGIYDLGIPYMASQYAIDHLELNPTIRDHVTHKKYPAGHMMYFHKPSRIKLREDLGDFIRNTK